MPPQPPGGGGQPALPPSPLEYAHSMMIGTPLDVTWAGGGWHLQRWDDRGNTIQEWDGLSLADMLDFASRGDAEWAAVVRGLAERIAVLAEWAPPDHAEIDRVARALRSLTRA